MPTPAAMLVGLAVVGIVAGIGALRHPVHVAAQKVVCVVTLGHKCPPKKVTQVKTQGS